MDRASHPNQDPALQSTSFPFKRLTGTLVVSLGIVVGMAWSTHSAYKRLAAALEQSLRAQELCGVIVHLDEVLTMSARMAAATGDPFWEQRYRRFSPQLDAAVMEALHLVSAPTAREAVVQTGAANAELVGLEDRAFALVRAGERAQAQAVLSGAKYEILKRAYADGMKQFTHDLTVQTADERRHYNRFATTVGLVAVLSLALLAMLWRQVLRRMARWRREQWLGARRLSDAERRTSDLQEEIAERRRVEQDLRENEERQRAILRTTRDGFWLLDRHGRFLDVNDAACAMVGFDHDELLAMGVADLEEQESAAEAAEHIARIIREGSDFFDSRMRRKDGTIIDVELSVTFLDRDGGRLVCFCRDTTGRKRADEALRYQERLLSDVGAIAHVGGWEFDAVTGKGAWTDEVARIHDLDPSVEPSVALGLGVYRGDSRVRIEAALRDAIERGIPYDLELELTTAKGNRKWARAIGEAVHEGGKVVRVRGSFQDVTERKRAEIALRESEERIRLLLDSTAEAIYGIDPAGRCTFANRACVALLGYGDVSELLGKDMHALIHYRSESGSPHDLVDCPIRTALEQGRGLHVEGEHLWRSDGTSFPVECWSHPVSRGNWLVGAVVTFVDITERQQVAAALRRSEERFRDIAESIREVFWMTSADWTQILYISPAYEHVWGRSCAALYAQPITWLDAMHPEDRERVEAAAARNYADHPSGIEYRIVRPDGEIRWIRDRAFPVQDESGEVTRVVGIAEDFTERRRVDQERAALEVQLRHAQKLEAIGQLAAGIAHEINTPTQYIGDNTRFVQEAFRDLAPVLAQHLRLVASLRAHAVDDEMIREAERAVAAADLDFVLVEVPKATEQTLEGVRRVAKIVQAMKEFSHPGTEEKTPVDLNRAIESTITVSRNDWKYVADLVTELDPGLPPVPCLPGEFNQVILNLLVNAAHAIADVVGDGEAGKGMITVRTRHRVIGWRCALATRERGFPKRRARRSSSRSSRRSRSARAPARGWRSRDR